VTPSERFALETFSDGLNVCDKEKSRDLHPAIFVFELTLLYYFLSLRSSRRS